MNLYRITANIVHHTTDKHGVSADVPKQVPTFLLDGDYLGIVDVAHAERIAKEVVCPVADDLQYESVTVHVTAVKL